MMSNRRSIGPQRRSVQAKLTRCTTSYAVSITLGYIFSAGQHASDRAESQYSWVARSVGERGTGALGVLLTEGKEFDRLGRQQRCRWTASEAVKSLKSIGRP